MGVLVTLNLFMVVITIATTILPEDNYLQQTKPLYVKDGNRRMVVTRNNYQSHQVFEPSSEVSSLRQQKQDLSVDVNKADSFSDEQYYKTSNNFDFEGPSQVESISTKSYHKEVEPFDVSDFTHHQDDQHAEVHYHQHKHTHKHQHKQDHLHKHKQEHNHQHGHDHRHTSEHHHTEQSVHKHDHHQKHTHSHKGEHEHEHHHGHHHSHHDEHRHGHKHSHHSEHKHDHSHRQKQDGHYFFVVKHKHGHRF